MSKNKCCCHSDDTQVRVETLTLDDGRRAERHVTSNDGVNEVIEVFAEEKRPLKLEKRITREMKNIVAKETHETIKDGEVAYEEILSLEPETPLRTMSRIGVVDHHKVVDGDYVRKEEIDKMIANGVVAGMTALMEHMEPKINQSVPKAQELVEKSVEEKKGSDKTVNIIMVAIIIVQIAFFGYIFLM